MALAKTERRKKTRIQLTRGLLARYGTTGAIILDITDAGARIEHFNRLDVHKTNSFRFEWQNTAIETTAEVVTCKIHRFAADDGGTNVYQSGLLFTAYAGNAQEVLKEMVSTIVARSLAEQVANARGLGPILESEKNMPVFRSGSVVGQGLEADQKGAARYIPSTDVVVDRGYVRCTLIDDKRFDKKWTRSPEQPLFGFTVSATEPPELIDQLCDSYLKGDAEQRNLILALAQASVDKS